MDKARVIFLITVVVIIGITLAGVIAMTVMEQHARDALPAGEQSAVVIESVYDGAVCLWCDITKMAILILGSLVTGTVLLSWGIYESILAGSRRLSIGGATKSTPRRS